MYHFGVDPGLAYAIDQLHVTAGVAGHHNRGARLLYIGELGVEHLVGGLGLGDIIDPCTATTLVWAV